MSISTVRQRYLDGDCGVAENIEQTLDLIRVENNRLNAFTHIAGQAALDQAVRLDRALAQHESPGALFGVPVAIKDNIDVRGMPTTAGIEAYQNKVAFVDAAVVQKLQRAGAIVVGKTNLPEGALGTRTDNRLFGPTDHPRRPGYSVGGSSGGSASAVAAGLVPAALGTDTMGSVRIPAAYCGVAGIKPSNGLVSLRGTVPLHLGFDSIGPIASNCTDLSLMLEAMAGYDPQCQSSRQPTPVRNSRRESLVGLATLCIDNLEQLGCDTTVMDGYQRVVEELQFQGVQLIRHSLDLDLTTLRRHGLVLIEAEAAGFHHETRQQQPHGFGPDFVKMLDYGAAASSQKLMLAQQALAQLRDQFDQLFSQARMIVLPTAPTRTPAMTDPVSAVEADLTALANFVGCPALSIPSAATDGLYAGVQLLMEPFSDSLLLKLGGLIERRISPAPTDDP